MQHRPRWSGHERKLVRILQEVYNPWLMRMKLRPIITLRAGKMAAIIMNEAVGRLLLHWRPGESRVLDWVGAGTKRVCQDIYGEEMDEALVRAFVLVEFSKSQCRSDYT